MSTGASHTAPLAPPERAPTCDLHRQVAYFSDDSLNRQLLDAIPTPLMILNQSHQIVYANRGALEMIAEEERQIHGLRPGEVLDCPVAVKAEGGCGTSEACRTCGAVLATLSGLAGRTDQQECRISRSREGQHEALDLRIKTTPLSCAGESFSVFTICDISHEKRRQVLEHIFFHDILNVTGSIRGFAELLLHQPPAEKEEIYTLIQAAADQTIEEIQNQRILVAAENQDLQSRPEPLHLIDFLQKTVGIYRRHEVTKERNLALESDVPEIIFHSDRALLGRVLGNMIKNALEACAPGETVTVGCSTIGERIQFRVHNPGVIPRETQLQIFQRSFSTKGPGRGLGTYSLRLLSGYLQGEVSFTSTKEGGTTFMATYPLHPAGAPASC
ncbi:MAG: PAS domain-containing sensor histidine kinase [Pedobacter sp.]